MSSTYGQYIQEIRKRIGQKSKEELIVELDLLNKAHHEVLNELKKRHERAAIDFAERSLK